MRSFEVLGSTFVERTTHGERRTTNEERES